MDRKPVTSSNIVSVGYDPETKDMEVEFRGGSTYTYHGVDQSAHDSFVNAESIGKHFHANIKGLKFTKGGAV